jgi:hypothetical protein
MKYIIQKAAFGTFFGLLFPLAALATPSTTYWAPSTAACQAWALPHVTYDTYFAGNGAYPIDTGLTSGFLPFEKIQGEVGFDLLYPTQDPLYLNAKLCTPESSIFNDSPALGFGIYNFGTRSNVTNYNVLYFVAQKSLPFGGYLAAGVYHGLTESLFTNSDGDVNQTGALFAFASPDIQIGLNGLKKINFVADIQTGKNILGAWGAGTYIYFTDSIDLLTGPVFFLDKDAQPGKQEFMWTVQLDIDISLNRPKHSE